MSSADARLQELGIRLPEPRPAAGSYVPWTRDGGLMFFAGQGADGHVGRVGADLTLAQGQEAGRAAALNLLTQAKAALGSLDAVAQIVRVHGWVCCAEGFTDLPEVVDGASDLLVDVYGDRGRHARTAVGVYMLPRGFAVEVEMVVAVDLRRARAADPVGSYQHHQVI